MKKITFTLLIYLLGAASIFAQAPQTFKYQAVIRDLSGAIIANQLVSMRIGIVQGSIDGTLIYSEIHNITTNQFGIIVPEIGRGTVETGIFKDIIWGVASQFLKLELDEIGGSNYQFMGTSELLSVPYSLNTSSLTLTSPSGGHYEVMVDNNGILIADCFPSASMADAGSDMTHAVSPINLVANTPESGTGIWTVISGTGGTIADPNNPLSSFSGLAENAYTLRWTISTICDTTSDEVDIDFYICPSTVSDLDGNTYNTVLIGTQCWMAENLNIGTMIFGGSNQGDNGMIEKYCYQHNPANCDVYGGLYQWNEAMQYVTTPGTQGICPTDWHLPTDAEWCILENFVDTGAVSCTDFGWRGTDAGNHLKESGQEHWSPPNFGATNSSGFTALGSGYRSTNGSFQNATISAHYWSSDNVNSYAWRRMLIYNNATVHRDNIHPMNSISVRCVKD